MFSRTRFVCLPLVICAGMLSATVGAEQVDRTGDGGGRHLRPYAILDRFKQAVTHVTLTEDEKPKVDQIFENASAEADQLARRTEGPTLAERQQALGDFARQLRQELSQVLTAGQMETVQLYLGPGPSSRPAADDFAGTGGGLMGNLSKAFAKLDLTPDQRQQVRDLMQSTRQKAQEIHAQTGNGGVVQSQMQQLRQDTRAKLQTILTPDQMQTLVQTLQQMRQEQSGATTRPQQQAGAPAVAPRTDDDAPDEPKPAPTASQTSPDVGSPVPDVKISELNGRTFVPANYKGHVLVLEFGSLSCPVFRDHVGEMEKLKSAEGPRAFFLLVYTREAFPAGDKDVQRNKDQNISVTDAKSLDERKTQAAQAQQALQITMATAVDSMDDAVSNAFGTFPNGSVVIGKDGKIAALEHWTNADSLRRAIDQAYEAIPASK